MIDLSIPIPNVPGQQDIEIEMSMNGVRQKLRYRVEIVRWADCHIGTEDRVDCIRDLVKSYSDEWIIYHIGLPTRDYIPLTFIRKEDWAAQHRWLWADEVV